MTETKVPKLPILEVFGPTIQGEGPAVGRKVMFIRTARCDYSCSWCDSAFTWDGSAKDQIRMLTPEEILVELQVLDPLFDYLVVSGGNPALIGQPMDNLIELLHSEGVTVAIETQGSKWQNWMEKVDDLIISPKAPSSKMKTDMDMLSHIVNTLTSDRLQPGGPNVSLKVVIFNAMDYEYARDIKKEFSTVPFFLSVGNTDVHESGNISSRILGDYADLVDKVLADVDMQNVRVLPQVHTLIWANKKGV